MWRPKNKINLSWVVLVPFAPQKAGNEMDERALLMIPGPTNVSPLVLGSLSKPTLSHVSLDFANILKETLKDLAQLFGTTGVVLPLAGTGTLGSEVALANILEPGDRVLAVCGGYFGERLADVAATLGASVDRIQVPWGSAAKAGEVHRKLSSASYKALLVVHVDTSTGAANPVKELAAVARENNALFVVDAVCSLAGMDLQMDPWGIDVCFTGSQKALAVPPGLAIVAFGSKALKVREERKVPIGTYYGDMKRWAPIMEDPTKYFATHPVNMIYALHDSCKAILAEGLSKRFARHSELGSAFRAAMRAIGLRLLCEEKVSSSTLTVAYYPEGVLDAVFRKAMAGNYGVVVAGGLGPTAQKAFRVGHMGNINRNDILATISAIEGSLADQGYNFPHGAGVAAANRSLR